MMRLLKIDFKKYFYSRTFWVLMLLYTGMILFILSFAETVLNSFVSNANTTTPFPLPEFSIYSYPLIWHNLTFLGGLDIVKLIMSLVIIIFIANEATTKTIRLNIMNGMSRGQYVFSKVLFVFSISLYTTLLLFITGLLLGFGHTEQFEMAMFFEKIMFLPAYFLEMFTFGSLVLFITFLVAKPILSVGLLSIYYFAEMIFSFSLPENIAKFLPFVSMRNIIDTPNSSIMKIFNFTFREHISTPDVIACLIYSMVFIGVVYLVMQKRDL